MKKLLFLFTILLLTFAACSDDDSNSEESKTYNLTTVIHTNAKGVEGNTFYWNPGATMSIYVTKNEEVSSPEATIERVDYYLDDELIAASAQAPFRISYDLSNETEGTHSLRIRVFWSAEGFSFQNDFMYQVIINATEGDDADGDLQIRIRVTTNAADPDNPYTWRQDEEMEFSVTINEEYTTPGLIVERIDYYLDGEFIGASSKQPYTLRYALDQVSAGSHVLTIRTICDYNGTSAQADFNLPLTVNEAQP